MPGAAGLDPGPPGILPSPAYTAPTPASLAQHLPEAGCGGVAREERCTLGALLSVRDAVAVRCRHRCAALRGAIITTTLLTGLGL